MFNDLFIHSFILLISHALLLYSFQAELRQGGNNSLPPITAPPTTTKPSRQPSKKPNKKKPRSKNGKKSTKAKGKKKRKSEKTMDDSGDLFE